MQEVKFTKAPWEASRRTSEYGDYIVIQTERVTGGWEVAEVRMDVPDAEANGYVMAAAPELYDALESTLMQCLAWQGEPHEHSCSVHKAVVERARSALSKARGEQC